MISICIACENMDDREAIIVLIKKQDDFHIVCIAEDGFDVIRSAINQHPDIIIMDLNLRDIEGLALAPIVKRKSPSTSLIVLCSQEESVTVEESLQAGISGCLFRQQGFDNLAASVRSVYYGGLYLPLQSACTAIRKTGNRALPVFTPTELGIFSGITLGCTDTEIAADLNISTGTLRNYVNQAKKKTGLRNRTQITIYALLNGMIRLKKFNGQYGNSGLELCAGGFHENRMLGL